MNIRLDDEGDYVPTIPFIRDKPRVGKTRKMMDKLLNRYFDKVVESEFNQQRMMGEKWREKRTMFDSYMNLSPGERRRIPIANMRGYQLLRSQQLLYSFEDNAVYNVDIDKTFNKLWVKSKNRDFSDMEKRAVFDNPFGYEPVSPFRIIFPTTEVRDMGGLQLVNIDDNIRAMSTAADNISTAAERMEATMQNVFAQQNILGQQNAVINNQIGDREEGNDENEERKEGEIVYYNNDGSPVTIIRKNQPYHYRGSKGYRKKIRLGWVDKGLSLELPRDKPLNVANTVQQIQTFDNTEILKKLDDIITMMDGFIIATNMHKVYGTLETIAERINYLEDKEEGLPMLNKLLSDIDKKVKTQGDALAKLNEQYANVIKDIATGDDSLMKNVIDLVNSQKSLIDASNKQIEEVKSVVPNAPETPPIEAIVPKQTEMKISELIDFLKKQYETFIEQIKILNETIAKYAPDNISKELTTINENMNEALVKFDDRLSRIENGVYTANQLMSSYSTETMKEMDELEDKVDDVYKHVTDGVNAVGQLILEGNDTIMQRQNMLTDQTNQMVGNVGNAVASANQSIQEQLGQQRQLLDEQAYRQYLINIGLSNNAELINQMYQTYMNLNARQTPTAVLTLDGENPKPINLIQDEVSEQQLNLAVPVIQQSRNGLAPSRIVRDRFDFSKPESEVNKSKVDPDTIKNDFIAFTRLLKANEHKVEFIDFARNVGFARLFSAYQSRNENNKLLDFFIRMANGKDMNDSKYLFDIQCYLFDNIPKRNDNYEELLYKTYNTVKEMFAQ